jgi:hypothetical protein
MRHPLARYRAARVRAALAAVVLVGSAVWSGAAIAAPGTPTPNASPDCSRGDPASWSRQMSTYADAGAYPAVQEATGDRVSSVLVEIPAIAFTGDGQSATLPVGPCQYIYRYRYSDVQASSGAAAPFAYVEVDWNTEGRPRGPNGSFSSPHFDFHFYLLPRAAIEQGLTCHLAANGKTCDPLTTDYAQMRRFQDLPDAAYVPATYRPDVDSAIPAMGLHLLDTSVDYTVENVNHYPTLIYGTFDGKIVFAEASVTLYTLQDAIAAPDHRISFPFRQPSAFASEIDWPTEYVIQYLPASGGFKTGFAGFEHHAAVSGG